MITTLYSCDGNRCNYKHTCLLFKTGKQFTMLKSIDNCNRYIDIREHFNTAYDAAKNLHGNLIGSNSII